MKLPKRTILKGSASNMARVILSMLVALVVPPFLVHRMVPAEYGAWLLILQCGGYINLLDLGLQTAMGKFVAQYDADGDLRSSGRVLSSSFAILCGSALVGALVICLIAWRVPQLFSQMPLTLIPELRTGILAVGLSTVLALPFSAFLGSFVGLQRYGFPTAVAMVSKGLSSAALVGIVLVHGTLAQMAAAIALFNVGTAVSQVLGWRRYVRSRVQFSWASIDRDMALRLAKYGGVLSIWTLAGLLIGGLDMVIVGHYNYANTAYYGIASAVTNFMVMVLCSLFAPLMPAVSSLQSSFTPLQLGAATIKATRYCILLLCAAGLPLIFGAYPLLKLWVGHDYAARSALFLQILVLGNAIRLFGYPYSLIVVATGKQHLATVSGVAEAIVNICISIYLVQRIGAVGVALGTLLGSFVSVGVHLGLSMKLARTTIFISRRLFVMEGLLRPLLCAVPSLLLIPLWRKSSMLPFSPPWMVLWILATVVIGWFTGLTREERHSLHGTLLRLAHSPDAQA